MIDQPVFLGLTRRSDGELIRVNRYRIMRYAPIVQDGQTIGTQIMLAPGVWDDVKESPTEIDERIGNVWPVRR